MNIEKMDFIKLTDDVIDITKLVNLVSSPCCGAINLFLGTTRDNFEGKSVIHLEYEAYHEMSEKEIKKLCTAAREKWSVKNIGIIHRLGVVPVCEVSVAIAVSSAHRKESLDCASFIINGLKERIPIWKREVYSDSSGEWKQNKECQWKVDDDNFTFDDAKSIGLNPLSSIQVVQNKTEEKVDSHSEINDVNSDLIQIHASPHEIKNRINAFCLRKRNEIDALNVQEFCLYRDSNNIGCARSDAVLVRSKDSKSHLKVTKVVNEWGPQTLEFEAPPANKIAVKDKFNAYGESGLCLEKRKAFFSTNSYNLKKEHNCNTGVEERLRNLETFLNCGVEKPVSSDIYTRLKALEDRVLCLESISPEYFQQMNFTAVNKSCVRELRSSENDMTIEDIDKKIHELKKKLLQ